NQYSTVMRDQALTQQSPRHFFNLNNKLKTNKRSHNAEVGGSSPPIATKINELDLFLPAFLRISGNPFPTL
ncbi:MAG: hypothetical protein ACREBU_19185, partial [Nitrososphaera sp.]